MSQADYIRVTRLEDFVFLNSGFYGCCMLLERRLVSLVLAHPVDYCVHHDHLVSLAALAYFAERVTALQATVLLTIFGFGIGVIFPVTMVAAQKAKLT